MTFFRKREAPLTQDEKAVEECGRCHLNKLMDEKQRDIYLRQIKDANSRALQRGQESDYFREKYETEREAHRKTAVEFAQYRAEHQ